MSIGRLSTSRATRRDSVGDAECRVQMVDGADGADEHVLDVM